MDNINITQNLVGELGGTSIFEDGENPKYTLSDSSSISLSESVAGSGLRAIRALREAYNFDIDLSDSDDDSEVDELSDDGDDDFYMDNESAGQGENTKEVKQPALKLSKKEKAENWALVKKFAHQSSIENSKAYYPDSKFPPFKGSINEFLRSEYPTAKSIQIVNADGGQCGAQFIKVDGKIKLVIKSTDVPAEVLRKPRIKEELCQIVQDNKNDLIAAKEKVNDYLTSNSSTKLEKMIAPIHEGPLTDSLISTLAKPFKVVVPKTRIQKTNDGKVYSIQKFLPNMGTLKSIGGTIKPFLPRSEPFNILFFSAATMEVDQNSGNILVYEKEDKTLGLAKIDNTLSLQGFDDIVSQRNMVSRYNCVSIHAPELLEQVLTEEEKTYVKNISVEEAIEDAISKNYLVRGSDKHKIFCDNIHRAKKLVDIPGMTIGKLRQGMVCERCLKVLELNPKIPTGELNLITLMTNGRFRSEFQRIKKAIKLQSVVRGYLSRKNNFIKP
ncbi:MAG: hypothetical protein S4CHLAM20_12460 [Chlamydiia bacterium]|nr:hypothetical protein [Chlamydiia bacterium]